MINNNDQFIHEREAEIDNKCAGLGEEIALVRRVLGYTQQDFAEIIGIKKNAICSYETNKNKVSLITALKIHFLLNVLLEAPEENALREPQVQVLLYSRPLFESYIKSHMSL